MSAEHVQARAGVYADSVTLMQVSAKARAVAGVQAALVAMGTELNIGMLASLGFTAPQVAGRPGGARTGGTRTGGTRTGAARTGAARTGAARTGAVGPAEIGPNDLLIAVRADDSDSLATALAVVDATLAARPGGVAAGSADQPPRTVGSAARRSAGGLVLISVPGPQVFAEAMDALESGCDVMIFSDNVPVEQEIALKDLAAERDLLVMGPDCGTAIVAGLGLGFAHSVSPGPIGVVAASGTGAQQVVCLLDAAGTGVSAVLGVGGRDLSAAVGGRSARAALAAMDADQATELIIVVSKPPAPQVAAELRRYAAGLATPVQFALIGPGQPDMTAAAEAALRAIGRPVPEWPAWPAMSSDPVAAGPQADAGPQARPQADTRAQASGPPHHSEAPSTGRPSPTSERSRSGEQLSTGERRQAGALRGLFAGGTLCDEAMVIAAGRLGPIYSNIPLRPEWRLRHEPAAGRALPAGHEPPADQEPAPGQEPAPRQEPPPGQEPAPGQEPGADYGSVAARHVMIDFGDDELTAGRPHPMIDQLLRLQRLAGEAADPATAVILLDVVLGHGAHPDPAAELAPAIAAAIASRSGPGGGAGQFQVVVSLIGARSDPQGLDRQALALRDAGAHVFVSNAAAVRFACDLIGRSTDDWSTDRQSTDRQSTDRQSTDGGPGGRASTAPAPHAGGKLAGAS